jgi:AcrR family transcriptional regulator
MPRPARVSPDRILAAAAVEFATRGYAGARVDRIARRARVNKAMLYYHFGSKQTLYRELLRRTFAEAGTRLSAIAAADQPPAAKLDGAIAAVAAFVQQHEFFPAIMLREVAEGGAHLDARTLATLAEVPRAAAAIFADGTRRGVFRPVHPMAAYFSMFAPIVMYLAGAPIRRQLASKRLAAGGELTAEAFIDHMQEMLKRGLAARSKP